MPPPAAPRRRRARPDRLRVVSCRHRPRLGRHVERSSADGRQRNRYGTAGAAGVADWRRRLPVAPPVLVAASRPVPRRADRAPPLCGLSSPAPPFFRHRQHRRRGPSRPLRPFPPVPPGAGRRPPSRFRPCRSSLLSQSCPPRQRFRPRRSHRSPIIMMATHPSRRWSRPCRFRRPFRCHSRPVPVLCPESWVASPEPLAQPTPASPASPARAAAITRARIGMPIDAPGDPESITKQKLLAVARRPAREDLRDGVARGLARAPLVRTTAPRRWRRSPSLWYSWKRAFCGWLEDIATKPAATMCAPRLTFR